MSGQAAQAFPKIKKTSGHWQWRPVVQGAARGSGGIHTDLTSKGNRLCGLHQLSHDATGTKYMRAPVVWRASLQIRSTVGIAANGVRRALDHVDAVSGGFCQAFIIVDIDLEIDTCMTHIDASMPW
jgi:hypothetical protein